MKKMIMGFVACALLITSCSKNEMLDGGPASDNDGKIKFGAINTLASTKAATNNPYGSTADLYKMGSFNVVGYGATGTPLVNVKYVDNLVTWNPTTSTWEYNNEPYWPDHAMNFYALGAKASVDALSTTVTLDKTNGVKIVGFKTGSQGDAITPSTNQIDLVVASNLGAIKELRTLLTFKHALTQINFKAMVIDASGLDVAIEKVYLHNIKHTADFTIGATPETDYMQNYWSNSSGLSDYDASPSAPVNLRTAGAIGNIGDITNAKLIKNGSDNLSLLLIPQNFGAWDNNSKKITENNDNNTIATPAKPNGAYIELKARISKTVNIEGGGGTTVVYYLGGASTYGSLYIPVSSEGVATNNKVNAPVGQWVPGRNINYVITFGDTGSGSGGGGYDVDGKPILVPIRFRAEVQDWVECEVPLLTATVTGNSNNVTAAFINTYVNHVLTDIKAAADIKTFKATVKITGTITTGFALNFTPFATPLGVAAMAKMAVGSTITYDLGSLTGIATNNITIPVAPSGWQFINAAGTVITPATITGPANGTIILRKL